MNKNQISAYVWYSMEINAAGMNQVTHGFRLDRSAFVKHAVEINIVYSSQISGASR